VLLLLLPLRSLLLLLLLLLFLQATNKPTWLTTQRRLVVTPSCVLASALNGVLQLQP
jgi:hypothetical protein